MEEMRLGEDPDDRKAFCPYFTKLLSPKEEAAETNHIRTHNGVGRGVRVERRGRRGSRWV